MSRADTDSGAPPTVDAELHQCPQQAPHEPHNYNAVGLADPFHCPGVGDKRTGADRRDAWDHPSHYGGKDNPHETIKCIRAHDLDFELGNAVKYIFRAGKKDKTKHIEDLRKAIQYIEFEIELVQARTCPTCHWGNNDGPPCADMWHVSRRTE